ncbi:MAG: hypothetical protein HGA22_13450, partial [Clostridiales bacterium]|nr:hypothetical protein [Clostridiales bacterium]
NKQDDLITEKNLKSGSQLISSGSHLSEDLYSFVMDPENEEYLKLAAELKSRGIVPAEVISRSSGNYK